jgi:hypothetical protein
MYENKSNLGIRQSEISVRVLFLIDLDIKEVILKKWERLYYYRDA